MVTGPGQQHSGYGGHLVLANPHTLAEHQERVDPLRRVVRRVCQLIVAPDIDSTGRIVLFGIAIILAFITWRTDYSKKSKQPVSHSDKAEQVGRTAGRLTGNAIASWKNRGKAS